MSPASGGVSEGLDTALARLLDRSGCVSREELVRALDEVRRGRVQNSDLSLGAELLSRGAVSAVDLDRALAQLTTPPLAPGAPQQIGPYRVLKVLGVGGMGKVFAVEHVETRRQEALKTVEVALDPDEAERFRREAEVLASLDHPGLIRIYGGDFESGRPYLTLELCEGGSLQSRLRHGPLPPADVLALAESLGSALDYLHARGVLHRDIKPDNVLFDSEGRPKLTDFGLARVRGAQGLTATGEILGTPAYMAPEQAGRAHEADARSDVYGLAATLYAAATGHPPFVGTGLFEVLAKVLEQAPASPASLGISLPAELEAGILAGLAKNQDERAASAGALVASLRNPEGRRARPRSKTRNRVLGGCALVACLGLALGLALHSPAPPPPPPVTPKETPSPRVALPLESLPPDELWVALAEGSGPIAPAVVAHAWSAILLQPPDRALERDLIGRGAEARLLVGYSRLKGSREFKECHPDLIHWEDFDGRREGFAAEFLTVKGLKAITHHMDLYPYGERLRALAAECVDLIKRKPLPQAWLNHYVGRLQRTYLNARRVLRPVAYKDLHGELAALKAATGGDLASVEARLAYYLQAFNQDVPRNGAEAIPLGVEISNPRICDQLALAFFKISYDPSEFVAEREARWVAKQATELGLTTHDLPARALLTLQQRLWRQATRARQPELLPIARRAMKDAGLHWKDHLQPRRLRNGIVQCLLEGKPAAARQALARYELEMTRSSEPTHRSFAAARLLFEAEILLIGGDPEGALELINQSRKFSLLETDAIRAHALKLSNDPSYQAHLLRFEKRVKEPYGTPAGLEYYLHNAREIIESGAWWPKHGPPKTR